MNALAQVCDVVSGSESVRNVMNVCWDEAGQLLVKTTLVASSGDLPVTGDGKSSLNR